MKFAKNGVKLTLRSSGTPRKMRNQLEKLRSDFMKKAMILSALLTMVLALQGAETKLPVPVKNGGMTLNEALNARKTIRKYKADMLTMQQISQLFWSAFGVNRADGKRTAPTARNCQEITLYMLTAKGAWAYAAKENKMIQVSTKDLRSNAGRFAAPIYIVIVSNSKLSGATPRALHYAAMDVGYVSQNIYLAAAAMKLGTCAIGSIPKPAVLAKELKLTQSEKVLLTHSVGIPK